MAMAQVIFLTGEMGSGQMNSSNLFLTIPILFHGRQNWNRQVKERPSLLAKADDRTFRLGDWQQRDSLPEDS